MLVHAKNPNGILHIGGYRIYGDGLGYPPCDLPFEIYNNCKEVLRDATYREGVLSKLFNKPFPVVAFTYKELRWLPEKLIDKIGPLIVDGYDLSWSHKKKIDQIKICFREKSPCL